MGRRYLVMGLIYLTLFVYLFLFSFLFFLPHSIRALSATDLGTSHNLSWRGGDGGEIGGPSIFFAWNMGGLKMPKDDLGGVFKFLLSSIPT